MYELIITVATLGAAVTGLLMSVPQLLRVVRYRTAEGVSVPGWTNGSITFAAWAVYVAAEGNYGLMAATIIPGLVWTAATVLVARRGGLPRGFKAWRSTISLLIAIAFVTALYFMGYGLLPAGLLLAIAELWVYAPSVAEAWSAPSVRGVSLTTWWLAAIEGLTFAIAGWPTIGTVLYGIVTVPLAIAVIVAVSMRRRREAPAVLVAPILFNRRASDIQDDHVGQDNPTPHRRRASDRVDEAPTSSSETPNPVATAVLVADDTEPQADNESAPSTSSSQGSEDSASLTPAWEASEPVAEQNAPRPVEATSVSRMLRLAAQVPSTFGDKNKPS